MMFAEKKKKEEKNGTRGGGMKGKSGGLQK